VVGQYQYDALNRRVGKLANPAGVPATTLYFYDAARIVEEQNAAAVTQATYVYGNYVDEVLTMDRGAPFYYHQNALWSVAAVTNAAGSPVERYAYDAYGLAAVTDGAFVPIPRNSWGTPHSAIGNPYFFTGRQLDEESGPYYYRARHYDPVKGRFLQRDPVGYLDGVNLYEYVHDNPVNSADPAGTCRREPCNIGEKVVDWRISAVEKINYGGAERVKRLAKETSELHVQYILRAKLLNDCTNRYCESIDPIPSEGYTSCGAYASSCIGIVAYTTWTDDTLWGLLPDTIAAKYQVITVCEIGCKCIYSKFPDPPPDVGQEIIDALTGKAWAKVAGRSPAAIKAIGNALFKAKEWAENVKSASEKSEELKKLIDDSQK
jgi:RHS repeat-associated protein